MSVFFKHNFTICKFKSSDSNWVILSPIKQRIKEKVEKNGLPLSQWKIKVSRGILTGCNEAFIISTKKRNEILNNCLTTNEKNITAELIRPILRGKDISTYSINWANLWLINIPSGYTKILMSELVEVKTPEQFMKDNFYGIWKHFIEYINFEKSKINKKGKGIKNRGDQGNYWWELRSCAYLADFTKQKIIFSEIVQKPQFYFDLKGFYPEATCFMIIGENLNYLIKILNSVLIGFIFKEYYSGGSLGNKGYRYKKKFLLNLPIPKFDKKNELFLEIINSKDLIAVEKAILNIFDFDCDEVEYLETQVLHE